MSNFICPHCQQIIDDGSDGFTSDREIELEKQLAGGLEREKIHLNRAFRAEKKLDIAVKALKKLEVIKGLNLSDKAKVSLSFKLSNEALTKIRRLKDDR